MPRLADERGVALIVAVFVMGAMLALGLGTYALADGQEKVSAGERLRGSSFNLAEAALNAQTFQLGRYWPGHSAAAYPATCTQAATVQRCPNRGALSQSFVSADFTKDSAWVTTVRDNGGTATTTYNASVVNAQPTWDSNHDGIVWVRAQALVRGKRRTLAAMVRVETTVEAMPRHVLTAGSFETTNTGNKVIVDTRGPSAQPAPLAVRCATRAAPCLGYDPSKGQVSPDTTQVSYAGTTALDSEAIGRLRDRAIANGTYYASSCPSNVSGAIVFVETGNCSPTSNANTATAPGMLIVMNGTFSIGGNMQFYGLLYMRNLQNSSGNVVSIGGTALIQGSVAIDGAGRLEAGASGVNLIFDDRSLATPVSFLGAEIRENTWRELGSGG
jgi:Tfp pilus assembly protein PilX